MATFGKAVYWLLGVAAFGLFAAGPALAYFDAAPGRIAFLLMGLGCMVGVLGSIVGIVILARRGPRSLYAPALMSFIPAAVLVYALVQQRGIPVINDITTDLADPPAFEHAQTLGPNTNRDMSFPREFADPIQEHYGDLDTLAINRPAADVFDRVLNAANGQAGWTVQATRITEEGDHYLEGTAETEVFGFVDDFVIRVRPVDEANCLVDMRSKSREGEGDLGANAERIRSFLDGLQRRVAPAQQ